MDRCFFDKTLIKQIKKTRERTSPETRKVLPGCFFEGLFRRPFLPGFLCRMRQFRGCFAYDGLLVKRVMHAIDDLILLVPFSR